MRTVIVCCLTIGLLLVPQRGMAAPDEPQPGAGTAPTAPDSAPRWTPRRIMLVLGAASAAVAGALAWSDEWALRSRVGALNALPPGDDAEWDRQFASARQLSAARDYWGAVALGTGGATIFYALVTRPPRAAGAASVSGARERKASLGVRVDPAAARLWVGWSVR